MAWTEITRIPTPDGRLMISYREAAAGQDKTWDFDTDAPDVAIAAEIIAARMQISSGTPGDDPIMRLIHGSSEVYTAAGTDVPAGGGIDVTFSPGGQTGIAEPTGASTQNVVGISRGLLMGEGDSVQFEELGTGSGTMIVHLTLAVHLGT